jgi:hypothetical protein
MPRRPGSAAKTENVYPGPRAGIFFNSRHELISSTPFQGGGAGLNPLFGTPRNQSVTNHGGNRTEKVRKHAHGCGRKMANKNGRVARAAPAGSAGLYVLPMCGSCAAG